jgi:proline iminopeptidase
MFANIRNTRLFFDIEGAGLIPDRDQMRQKPVAFLLHGGPGADHSAYKPTFSVLSEQLQLVYIDHRGQGRSARGDKATYTLDHNVEDLEALRHYLGLEQIIVIGGSYGGMVALAYAARYPQAVSRLIVMATAAQSGFLAKAQQNLAQLGTPEQQTIAQYLWDGNFPDEAKLREYFQVMRSLYSITYDPAVPDVSGDRTILSVDAINVAFGGFLRDYNILAELPHITAPTLVIGAQHDWICPPEFSIAIAQHIPQAQLEIFENSGHLLRVDAPERLLEIIGNFLPGLADAQDGQD